MLKNKALFLSIFGGIVLVAAIAWFWPKPKPPEDPRQAKEFALKDANGKLHRLADYKEKVLVLHFWAKWCAPCLAEIPVILKFARKFEKNDRVKFIAISLDSNWKDAHKVLPEKDLPKNMISLLDPENQSADAYGSFKYPETYLLDSGHRIVSKWVGPQEWGHPFFEEVIKKL